jgi:hypothetical protein
MITGTFIEVPQARTASQVLEERMRVCKRGADPPRWACPGTEVGFSRLPSMSRVFQYPAELPHRRAESGDSVPETKNTARAGRGRAQRHRPYVSMAIPSHRMASPHCDSLLKR